MSEVFYTLTFVDPTGAKIRSKHRFETDALACAHGNYELDEGYYLGYEVHKHGEPELVAVNKRNVPEKSRGWLVRLLKDTR